MEVDEAPVGGAHAFMLLMARFLGLAPVTFHMIEKKKDKKEESFIRKIVKKSKTVKILSFVSVFPIAAISIYGLYTELTTEKGLSIWMDKPTGRIVGSCNVIVVVISSLVSICTAPARIKRVLFVLNILEEIDRGLGHIRAKHEERNKYLAVIFILIAWSGLLGFDVLIYIVEAFKVNTHFSFIRNFVCFYFLYYVVMMMATHFAFTTHSIQLRLKKINDHLENLYHSNLNSTVKLEAETTFRSFTEEQINIDVEPQKNCSTMCNGVTKKSLRQLAEYHEMICLIAKEVNSAFGLPVFIILIGTILHLIVTPYFLILELGTNRWPPVAVQSLWCVAHASRLILLVEPCHRTKMEATRTNSIVADMLGKPNIDKETLRQLTTFSQQLLHRSVNFTALGVCNLDRTLIASVATAVTTYLVILIQFQK